MGRLYLKFPTIDDEQNVMDYRAEFLEAGQQLAGSGALDKFENYEDWLVKVNNELKKETCEEGRIPATQFLTYRKEDNKLVGMIQIRHYLNEYLLNFAGHIGDSVRPSEQRKGYATEQIGLALKEAKKLGIERVLMTCDDVNIASAKSIINNGGVLENEIFHDGKTTQRYWIDVQY